MRGSRPAQPESSGRAGPGHELLDRPERRQPVEWSGLKIYNSFDIGSLDRPHELWFRATSLNPGAGPQHVKVGIYRHKWRGRGIEHRGQRERAILFPVDHRVGESVGPIFCRPPRASEARLGLANGWRDDRPGYPQTSIGNCGMLITRVSEGEYELQCSRGGPHSWTPSFDAMTLTVFLRPDGDERPAPPWVSTSA